MSIFKMPLENIPQIFDIVIGDKECTITCKWNDALDGMWLLDIADAVSNTSIVAGIPLLAGVNLLDGLDYLGFSGILFVYTDGDQYASPTLDNLGIESNLYYQTDDA